MNPISASMMFGQKEKVRGMEGLRSPRPIDGVAGKADQTSADYTGAEIKCNRCVHFDMVDSCSKVDGKIDPEGRSKYFEAKEEERTPPEGEVSDSDQDDY